MQERITKSVIEIEGMAIVGLIKEIFLEDCEEPKEWKKLIAIDLEGLVYETKCIEPQAAKRNFMVISSYTRKWSKPIIGEDKSLSGETL